MEGDEARMVTENNLRCVRTLRGLSQLELSVKTRIAPGIISNLENGKIYAYPGWRKRLAGALGVPESKLFPEVSDGDRKSNTQ